MTREEAIFTIEHRDGIMDYGETEQLAEALEIAIESLKAEPCEDAVSREAVMRTLTELGYGDEENGADAEYMSALWDVAEKVKALPPVTPKPKTGKWIDDKCSVCGKGIEDLISSPEWYRNEEPNFCPFCGVKMEEGVSE